MSDKQHVCVPDRIQRCARNDTEVCHISSRCVCVPDRLQRCARRDTEVCQTGYRGVPDNQQVRVCQIILSRPRCTEQAALNRALTVALPVQAVFAGYRQQDEPKSGHLPQLQFQVCSTCRQVLAPKDMAHHNAAHDSDFPSLSSLNGAISARLPFAK